MSGLNARFSPPPLSFLNTLQCAPACLGTEALQGTSPLTREFFVAAWPVAASLEKTS
jgi:hypothetical protein